ncbi:Phosphatidylinositol 4-phosphate 5-kinase 1 [Hondaea fermentalgiana]|uniref:Phosphatidylinositol 4-phosphate 5-kinase 1 n=1 Tax=Hondaea fermentalgiana TaxID=2315210 RepID=A0A2R5GDA8_9STRA|nr:Phosphatidylinositol 4-phosphate 5-kinase 1 [Hondaea fermentalgiana]|eukprot:GBG27708.1 Phosphatidylinositol 4-phosphate 5-kinase 1 [Hondaea fermentalgiana]
MEKIETAEECAEAPAAIRTEDQELRHHEGVDDDALKHDDQNDDDQNGNEEGGGAKTLGGETLQKLASGIFRWIEGHVYAGAFRDGVPDGEGSKRLADGRQYKGAWRAGKAHGWGVRTYPNGDCHEGMYQNDKRHGFGRYRWHDGEQVDGFWVDGVLQGRARRVFANGDVVHCNARDNRFAGLGVRRSTGYRLGCYVGYLDEEGLPKGLGCANEIFQRSQRLLGPFGSARTVTGFGIKDFASNTFYAGDMVNSIPHGLGIFQWQDKTIHRGRWRFGKQHGFGRTEYFVNSNRTVCVQGTWNNGSLDGECIAEVVTSDGKMWHFASRWILGEKVSSSPRREVFKSLLHSPMVQTIQAHGQAESAAQDSLDMEPNAAPQFPDDTLAHAMVPNFDPFGLMPDINPVLQLLLDDLF